MAWRKAKSLTTLHRELAAVFPHRDTTSDGSIGDTAHAARSSKHNPGPDGIVEAEDDDEDVDGHNDESGRELWAFVQALLQCAREKHPALHGPGAHIIYEGRIWSYAHGWVERAYTGENAHRKHAHVAVVDGPGKDSTKPWNLAARLKKPIPPKPDRWLGLANPPMTGHDVRGVHDALIKLDPANKARLGADYPDMAYREPTRRLVQVLKDNRPGMPELRAEAGVGPITLRYLRTVAHP
jgi:hypothetical protein